jgi:predicted TIM-barrel fold metal-dependent hydrolase
VEPIFASDLTALLDAAGMERAIVLSVAYIFGSPQRAIESEREKVEEENDWTSEQVGRFSNRLRGFCSINPLRDYALEELARCANKTPPYSGLKLHFANSGVDYHDSRHIERLRRVFQAANGYGMPMVLHMMPNVRQGLPYGRDEARIFLDHVLPAAPDVTVQVAHLGGTGEYSDPRVDDALGVFVDLIEKHDPRAEQLCFDVTAIATAKMSAEHASRAALRIRQLGVHCVLYGSDAAIGGNLPPREGWAAFRQLPLSDAEIRTIATNIAPYAR